MLTQLPEHFQPMFATNWEHLLQQKESRLESKVLKDSIQGKERQYSQLGKSKMRLITTRNGDTVPSDSPMAKRWLRLKAYDEVTYIDEFDSVALGKLPTPESEHVQAHAFAANRQKDQTIIDAAEGDAYIGETGTTAVPVPAGQKVAVNLGGSNVGLTLAKLVRAKYILDKNEVPAEGRTFVCSAKQLEDLLTNVVEVKSSDYNNVKALVDGNVNRFMGFDFVMTELLTLVTATDVRTCIAFQRDGLVLGVGQDRTVNIDILPMKNHTTQIRTKILLGATRKEEERVVLVYCDESP